MAELIRILSTTTIQPESGDRNSDFNRKIELTPCDLQIIWHGYMHRGLLFKKPNEIPLEHLKATLSLALDRLYPLAGRLVATEHDGDAKTVSFRIECNNAGAKFVHAKADDSITAADIPTEIVDRLFLMAGISNHQAVGSDLPLLAVQVTEFADGVYVAVSLNHSVADGTTLWDFFNVWSELARGDSAAISKRTDFVFGRECLDGLVDFPVRIPLRPSPSQNPVPPVPVERRVLRFSKAKITALKARANAESPGVGREISSLQAVMAHLWVCITRSRDLKPDMKVCFLTAVGMRSRLRPPLPRFYVGSAVVTSVVMCTAGELLGFGPGQAARRINEAVAAYAAVEAKKFFDGCATRSLSLVGFGRTPMNVVAFTGSSRFDVYGNDFGWGRPVAQGSCLAGGADGRLNVSPGAEEGSVDFEAILSAKTIHALANDQEFTDFCS